MEKGSGKPNIQPWQTPHCHFLIVLFRQGDGTGGVSTFAGVTVRGYVTNRGAADIEKKIATKALSAAKALPSPTIRNASLTKEDAGQWHRGRIGYDVEYGDYGGRANVDFYTTEKNGNTIVLVFMYVDMDNNLATVQQILKSFSW